MNKFQSSTRQQMTKNVFAFIKNNEAILFNRLNFQRKRIGNKNFLSLVRQLANEMEKRTTKIKFSLPALKKLRIEVTLGCNCNCDYCLVYQNEIKGIDTSMNKSTARKIISFYNKNIKNGSIMLIGGEPLINWEVVKLFIREIKNPIKIFTNGTIINQEIIEIFKKNKNVTLMISLDGRKKDNKRRKFKDGKQIYPKVIKNIKTFQKNDCKIGIACLCTNENVDHLYDIIKFFVNDLKVKEIGIGFPHYITSDFNKITDLDINRYVNQMIKIFDFAVQNRVYVDQIAKRLSPLITGKFRFYSCKLIGEQGTFYPDGTGTFCTKIDSLDNPKKYNLVYFKNTLPVNNRFCQNCPAIGICGGGCFWDGIMRFKNGVDERECIINNTLLDYFLWNISSIEKKGINPKEKFNHLVIRQLNYEA